MTNVILVAHILVSIILVIVVLMQRSEGGALGIGGGGGGAGGGLMSGRGVKGALVRTTIIFGAIFFVSSLTLTTLASRDNAASNDIIPTEITETGEAVAPDNLGIDDLDDILGSGGDLLEDPLAVSSSDPVNDDPRGEAEAPDAAADEDSPSDETP